ncbi:glycoside hydrolase family 88 protein [Rhizobium pusense]|uniref:Glycosyl hydrolase n=3 Tax=Agrobacterium TaxID=357 RepID=A0A6H0ZFV4_9HYPH|nr:MULTISPECIES: glycoside hydrolase family 88 protein [Agrobacterium]THD29930.1 MAG: glycosyl hydrolase [Flavobacterium johnsoniae]MCA2371101.1 glycoside hydrolase family 88 protein [Agrobacterium tomkonis CIP 111-78]MDH0117836.1 glycoside hydrolase family 88 protein [Agrobacterium pusense]MDH0912672.1 glycoside hydrolase family 88 protein [Agrobacterium pusense]MDH1098955.1 glycoside hydrolase family 88 protein [Agrobacterium pusense]
MADMVGKQDIKIWQPAMQRMISRIDATIEMRLDGFPHFADPTTGVWTTTPEGFWTGGFWIGELWLAGALTQQKSYSDEAKRWLAKLETRIESQTVFRGFLFYYGAVVGALLHREPLAERFAALASASLLQQYDGNAGIIPLGSEAEEAHAVGNGEANIDGLPATPLMLWVARHLGDPEMRQIALNHAYKSGEFFIRPDGGVVQSASFDRGTGVLSRRYTHKGYSDTSIWTRAQAWAMLGYALSAQIEPKERQLLELATKVADWWVEHLPDDGVAYWDFDAPVTSDTKKDTSGTAIASAALLKLSALHPDPSKASQYSATARRSLEALVERHLTDDGILADGCFDPKNDKAVNSELIWGDYFLLECLGVLTGRINSAL